MFIHLYSKTSREETAIILRYGFTTEPQIGQSTLLFLLQSNEEYSALPVWISDKIMDVIDIQIQMKFIQLMWSFYWKSFTELSKNHGKIPNNPIQNIIKWMLSLVYLEWICPGLWSCLIFLNCKMRIKTEWPSQSYCGN